MPKRADRPDIEIGAAFKAETLRFREVPDTDVRYVGGAKSATKRMNLPRQGEPQVSSEDVESSCHAQVRVVARQVAVSSDEGNPPRRRPRCA